MEWSSDLLVDAVFRFAGSHPAVVSVGWMRYILSGCGILWGGYKLGKVHEAQRRSDQEITEIKSYLKLRLPMPEFIKSPNYTKGRGIRKVKKVVIHSMAGFMEPSIRAFQDPKREASAHYLIGHDGREVQMVEEKNTAWHCGARLLYRLRYPFNNADTIGIETEGGDFGGEHHPLQDAGYESTAKRVAQIHRDHNLGEPTRSTVVMHREMPGTATACPTGVDIDRVASLARDYYIGVTLTTVVPVHNPEAQTVAMPITRKTYAPFEKDLHYKDVYDPEVARIQSYLVDKGFMPKSDLDWNGIVGAGSGWYGKKTSAAVDRFQKAHGITASKGYFGWWYKRTREAANRELSI